MWVSKRGSLGRQNTEKDKVQDRLWSKTGTGRENARSAELNENQMDRKRDGGRGAVENQTEKEKA